MQTFLRMHHLHPIIKSWFRLWPTTTTTKSNRFSGLWNVCYTFYACNFCKTESIFIYWKEYTVTTTDLLFFMLLVLWLRKRNKMDWNHSYCYDDCYEGNIVNKILFVFLLNFVQQNEQRATISFSFKPYNVQHTEPTIYRYR